MRKNCSNILSLEVAQSAIYLQYVLGNLSLRKGLRFDGKNKCFIKAMHSRSYHIIFLCHKY